jgi:hypothetical protein
MAAAFGVSEAELPHEFARRVANPQRTVTVSSDDAPVHQVKLTGKDIDLTSCRSTRSTSSTGASISPQASTM